LTRNENPTWQRPRSPPQTRSQAVPFREQQQTIEILKKGVPRTLAA
jgi:hypothetical protein